MAKERLLNYKISEVSTDALELLLNTIQEDHDRYHFDEVRVVGISVTRGLCFPDEETTESNDYTSREYDDESKTFHS